MITIRYTQAGNDYPDEDPASIALSLTHGFPGDTDLADLGAVAATIETALHDAGCQTRRLTTTSVTTTTPVPAGSQTVTETTVVTTAWTYPEEP